MCSYIFFGGGVRASKESYCGSNGGLSGLRSTWISRLLSSASDSLLTGRSILWEALDFRGSTSILIALDEGCGSGEDASAVEVALLLESPGSIFTLAALVFPILLVSSFTGCSSTTLATTTGEAERCTTGSISSPVRRSGKAGFSRCKLAFEYGQ